MFKRPAPLSTSSALGSAAHSRSAARRWTTRLGASIAAGSLALTLVACSSGSSAASSSTSTPTATATVTSTAVVTTDSTAVQTSTMTATSTAVVTSTSVTTRTRDHTDTSTSSNSNTTPTPGPIPCPGSQTLTALLPSGDQSVPVSGIACSGEWAVGNYSQAGRNQVVGIFHYGTADGHWGLYPKATACAAAVNLPPSLYKQACTTS